MEQILSWRRSEAPAEDEDPHGARPFRPHWMADGVDPDPRAMPWAEGGRPVRASSQREPPLRVATTSMRAEGLRSLSPAQRAGFQARTPHIHPSPNGARYFSACLSTRKRDEGTTRARRLDRLSIG